MKAANYKGKKVVLATKHGKERAARRPLKAALGLEVIVPENIETDAFGTFSGEIERPENPRTVLLQKARLGMKQSGLRLGLASEGSFYPHPSLPFMTVDDELMVFIDDETGLIVVERTISTETNFAHAKIRSSEEIKDFLRRAKFPNHAVILRPNDRVNSNLIFKGLTDFEAVELALEKSLNASTDKTAHIETDMRAHLNPSRMRVIRRLAFKLARRLLCNCPVCEVPGFGFVRNETGLPCGLCGTPTDLIHYEIFGCQSCSHEEKKPKKAVESEADPMYCPNCNP